MEALDFLLSLLQTQDRGRGCTCFSKGPAWILIGSAYITFSLLNQSLSLVHERCSHWPGLDHVPSSGMRGQDQPYLNPKF